ncbi:hypothetical protein TNCV_2185281 [Trichonephila clavipes]|nr:hypothetical protein TNCV_2185281 [Trichonephila clavipes]
MFENTKFFTDRSKSDGYSCHEVHFKFEGRVVNHGSENFQILMNPSERLIIRLLPRWIFFPVQSNSNTSISVGQAADEVDIFQLRVHIKRFMFIAHCQCLKMRKSHVPTLQAHEQHHLWLSVPVFSCNYDSTIFSTSPPSLHIVSGDTL